jgi:hypothetical protein
MGETKMASSFVKKVFLFSLIFSATAFISFAWANDDSPVGKDRFKLTIGGFFPAISSKLQVDSKQLGAGTNIDLESDLGFDENVNLFVLGGYWRFAQKHRLYWGYYGFDRDTTTTLTKDIEWDDKVFKAEAKLQSEWEIDFTYGKYGYSFFQGDKWEVSGSLGIYYLDTAITLKGEAEINNGEAGVSTEVTEEESIGLPIPLFGLTAEYYITPKWRAITSASYFTISLDEWDGSILELSANLEYLFHKNFGIGTGYLYFMADIERDRTKRASKLDYEYQGVRIYGIWHF